MSIDESLLFIQQELKAPKGQFNKFGNFYYRSCEDILEGVKPLLKARGCVLTLSDTVKAVGDRVYVEACATLSDGEHVKQVTAYAREAETKKGMDDSQITGTASSYARKYALNGLFCIDDTKDSDSMDNSGDMIDGFIKKLDNAKSMDELQAAWSSIPKDFQKNCEPAKNKAKERLS